MNSALALGFGHALNAVDAALEFEPRISALALYHKAYFLISAELGRIFIHYFGFPALALGIHTVHTEKRAGKKSCLLAACTAANFDYYVFIVVRVFRQQQHL